MVDAPSEHNPITLSNGTLYASNTASNALYTVLASLASNSYNHKHICNIQHNNIKRYDAIGLVYVTIPCSASVSVRTSPLYRQTFTNTFRFPFMLMSEASSKESKEMNDIIEG